MHRKVIALLPMKGHSERVPNKNLRSFCGRPLYRHVLETLLASPRVAKVVINTDSESIKADVASSFPERVVLHDRPAAICGDFVSMNRIIECDLGLTPEVHFLQTHSTNPLLTRRSIDAAIERYFVGLDEGYDSLFSVTRVHKRFYDAAARPVNHDPRELLRTQDLPPFFEENSCLYLFSRESFVRAGGRIGDRPCLWELPAAEALDIDEELDFLMAEFLKRMQLNAAAAPADTFHG